MAIGFSTKDLKEWQEAYLTKIKQPKKDAIEIVRRLKERNPEFFQQIKDKTISLEDFAEIVITQYRAFINIK